MPNCDWGRPCNCIDCRTNVFGITCNSCGFENTVSYVMAETKAEIDRKGMFSYEFQKRTENICELTCFKCGELNTDVPYYENIVKSANERNLQQKVCKDCGIKEFDTIKIVKYIEWKSETFCSSCAEKRFISEVPNPSTKDRVFKVDTRSMKYVLDKIKVPCASCGRNRWVKAENQWKKQCLNCYKKAL